MKEKFEKLNADKFQPLPIDATKLIMGGAPTYCTTANYWIWESDSPVDDTPPPGSYVTSISHGGQVTRDPIV